MLDTQKTAIFKIKEAFRLNGQEADELLNSIYPDGVYPFEIWHKAYEPLGMSVFHRNMRQGQEVYCNYILPENLPKYCPTRVYAIEIVASVIEPARLTKVSNLERGYDYVIQATYDDSTFPYAEEKSTLFHFLRKESDKFHRQNKENATMWIRFHQATQYYNFLHEMFADTIVVDKADAIRHLVACGFPLHQEVKGITQSLVDSVIKAAAQEALPVPESAPALDEPTADVPPKEQGNVIRVPAALWEGKSDTSVREAMRAEFDDSVIAYVLFRWCKVQKTRIGSLLWKKKYPEDEKPTDGKTYRNLANKLLKEADSLTIVKA